MKKPIIIVAIILIVLGLAIFAVIYFAADRDLSNLRVAEGETNTYNVEESFQKIDIEVREANIELKKAEDGKCSVVCVESDKVRHTVSVEESTLKITVNDSRKWYDRWSFLSSEYSITLYLPTDEYESLKIDTGTSDVTVPDGFLFGSVDIKGGTGDVIFNANGTQYVKIETSTGDISMKGVSAGEIGLVLSTGDVIEEGVSCEKGLSISVSTGNVTLTDVTCQTLFTKGSTGNLKLKNVVAAGDFSIERSTGDIRFESCDAAKIAISTSTGDVTGSFKTAKIIFAKTTTGDIDVPERLVGGECTIKTSTGDIRVELLGE